MRNPRSLPSMERKDKNNQVLILRPAFPRKSNLRRIATCVRNMGAHIQLTRLVNVKYEKDGTEKSSFRAAKKGGKKNYPVNQNFTQLTKKIKKLEKALKKSGKKASNAVMRIAIPTLNRELGLVALGKS
jgi:hypothetical protein